jgi:hypothetical protein
VAISTASRSSGPLWRRPRKISSSNWLTYWATSRWIVCAFFFLRCQRLVNRAQQANLLVDREQLTAQFPKAVKRLDLALRLAALGRGSKGFTHRLAVHFPGQAVVRTMSRLPRLMAAATGFATAATDGGDGAAAEVP